MKFVQCGLVLVLSAGIGETAAASCGSATCPLDHYRYLTAGRINVLVAYEYIDQNRIYAGSSATFIGALPNAHDEVETINRRNLLGFQYGISDAVAVSVELPFVHREHTHLENGKMESFNFSGLGDMVMGVEYAPLRGSGDFDPSLSITLGAKLPTGVTDRAGSAGETAEVTIQPGTGSLDALVGLNYRQNLLTVATLSGEYSVLPITAGLSYQLNGKGTSGYRVGNTLMAHVGTEYQLLERVSVLLQLNGMFRGYADVGSTGEYRGNTGGAWVFVSPGLSLHLSDAISAFGFVQLPVYVNVHGIQQTSKFNLQFGISANVGLFG